MSYLLCFIPPLAVLRVGKPFQAIISVILTLFFYLPGVIHALLLVRDYKADQRMKKQVKMMKEV